jgi:hypothetical protein
MHSSEFSMPAYYRGNSKAFSKIAKRPGQDRIVFQVYFHDEHKSFPGQWSAKQGPVGWDIAKGLELARSTFGEKAWCGMYSKVRLM